MYKCPICALETKQLNGLLSRHFKKHCSASYTKEQYKVDILNANGRPQQHCRVCSKPTIIPKGECEYPVYCKACYNNLLSNSTGDKNHNWRGGKIMIRCVECGESKEVHPSVPNGKKEFCSISCSTTHYYRPENRSEAREAAILMQKEVLRKMHKSPKFRAAWAAARAKLGNIRKSQKETDCYDLMKTIYPDTISSHLVKYYTFDMFIPSLNLLVEFDGTYWHSMPSCISLDKRKDTFIARWHKHLKLVRIPEATWDDIENVSDKLQYLKEITYV